MPNVKFIKPKWKSDFWLYLINQTNTPPPLLTGPNLAPFGEESKNMIGQRKRNVSKINSEREQLRLFGTRSPIGVV